jgi:hypothetical protein
MISDPGRDLSQSLSDRDAACSAYGGLPPAGSKAFAEEPRLAVRLVPDIGEKKTCANTDPITSHQARGRRSKHC